MCDLTDFAGWEYKDKLTGLYNRNYLDAESDHMVQAGDFPTSLRKTGIPGGTGVNKTYIIDITKYHFCIRNPLKSLL